MKRSRIKVDFTSPKDQSAIALARLGLSTEAIAGQSTLSEGQVAYRLRRERELTNRRPGYSNGLRAEWRTGQSALFRRVRDDVIQVLRKDAERTLTPLIVHKTYDNENTQA